MHYDGGCFTRVPEANDIVTYIRNWTSKEDVHAWTADVIWTEKRARKHVFPADKTIFLTYKKKPIRKTERTVNFHLLTNLTPRGVLRGQNASAKMDLWQVHDLDNRYSYDPSGTLGDVKIARKIGKIRNQFLRYLWFMDAWAVVLSLFGRKRKRSRLTNTTSRGWVIMKYG